MAKMVGLSRNIKLSWLNEIVELMDHETEKAVIKDKLNEYLSFEIASPTNLRKTREILLNIWFYDNLYTEKLRNKALQLIRKYPDYALEIHWCMMLAAYPVFVDLCKLIGKMTEFQSELTLVQIKQKLFDEWGERTTLFHSIDKNIATLKAFGILIGNKPGRYQVCKHSVTNTKIISFMIYTLMLIDKSAYYSFDELNASPYLFPFEYELKKEILWEDPRFVINNFNGELSVAVKNHP